LEETLKLGWNEAEKAHINQLYNAVLTHPKWFEDNISEKVEKEFEIYAYEWVEYGTEYLGWTQEIIYAVGMSGEELVNTSGNLLMGKNNVYPRLKATDDEKPLPECGCTTKDYMTCTAIEHCALPGRFDSCSPTNRGCGLLWLYSCDGNCYPGKY
jgi:hypothetical protein